MPKFDDAVPHRPSRRFVPRMFGASAVACPICLSSLLRAPGAPAAETGAGAHVAPHWSYEGAGAPQNWGKLEPQFKVCELDLEQTPIDLPTPARDKLADMIVARPDAPAKGHRRLTAAAPSARSAARR